MASPRRRSGLLLLDWCRAIALGPCRYIPCTFQHSSTVRNLEQAFLMLEPTRHIPSLSKLSPKLNRDKVRSGPYTDLSYTPNGVLVICTYVCIRTSLASETMQICLSSINNQHTAFHDLHIKLACSTICFSGEGGTLLEKACGEAAAPTGFWVLNCCYTGACHLWHRAGLSPKEK